MDQGSAPRVREGLKTQQMVNARRIQRFKHILLW
jgi:hypothetical protein